MSPTGAAASNVHHNQRRAGHDRLTVHEQLSRQELLGLLAERDRLVGQLRARVAELEEQLASLERLVSRNSGNSSFPPSADDLPGRPARYAWPAPAAFQRPAPVLPPAASHRRKC
jgi:Family of unknown function (DUF6444)